MKKILAASAIALTIALACVMVSRTAIAAEKDILIVFDASGSMKDKLGGQAKIDFAKTDADNLLSSLDPTINVGLRPLAYTSQTDKTSACTDSALVQAFTTDHSSVSSQIDGLQAIGLYTPLAYALTQAKDDFTAGNDNVLILLTDGQENCGGDPAQAAADLKSAGVNVKTYVIGLGATAAMKSQLSAIAKSGGGTYYDANDSASLASSFQAIVKAEKPIDKTNMDSLLGKEVTGGNGFDTAVDITPGDYHLSHNQLGSQYDYFKMPVTAGEKLKLSIQSSECNVYYNSKTNTFTEETSDCGGDLAEMSIYSQRRARLLSVVAITKSELRSENLTVADDGILYLKVGNDGSKNQVMSKKSIFSIEVIKPTPVTTTQAQSITNQALPPNTPTNAQPGTNVVPPSVQQNIDNASKVIADGTKWVFYAVITGIIGFIIIITVIVLIIVMVVKKNNKQRPPNNPRPPTAPGMAPPFAQAPAQRQQPNIPQAPINPSPAPTNPIPPQQQQPPVNQNIARPPSAPTDQMLPR